MYKYKNNSQGTQVVVGHGVVKAGETIESRSPIENPNFELISNEAENTMVGTEAPQPNAVIEAEPINTEVQ